MRLWSLHPKYLDRQGLLAAWREGLLAQKVLQGGTRGYRNHPQLERFKLQPDPVAAISAYLKGIRAEAETRGYAFDRSRIVRKKAPPLIACTRGQMTHELDHLKRKLQKRDAGRFEKLRHLRRALAHPLFVIVPGEVEIWEKF
jgi:hypothetical protein